MRWDQAKTNVSLLIWVIMGCTQMLWSEIAHHSPCRHGRQHGKLSPVISPTFQQWLDVMLEIWTFVGFEFCCYPCQPPALRPKLSPLSDPHFKRIDQTWKRSKHVNRDQSSDWLICNTACLICIGGDVFVKQSTALQALWHIGCLWGVWCFCAH